MGNGESCVNLSRKERAAFRRERPYAKEVHADASSDDETYVSTVLSKYALCSNEFTNGHLNEVQWTRWKKKFPGLNTTKDVMRGLKKGRASNICRHVMLSEELDDYLEVREDSKSSSSEDKIVVASLVDAMDAVNWSEAISSEAFLDGRTWSANETDFVEFVRFVDAAHEGVIKGGRSALDDAKTSDARRRIVFESLDAYWRRELEVIGNGVLGTKGTGAKEMLEILKSDSHRGRALRVALTMELVCD